MGALMHINILNFKHTFFVGTGKKKTSDSQIYIHETTNQNILYLVIGLFFFFF